MIEIVQGNIITAEAEALVNTVNCVGFMGKGIALQFKQAYPANYQAYRKACDSDEVQLGRMFIYDTGSMLHGRYVINFPTKHHWKGKSRYEDIQAGLEALVADVQRLEIRSIAIPPLGCGLGGLDWRKVRPMIENAFAALPEVRVLLFEPLGAPEPAAMPVRTARPQLTVARAMFLKLMDLYAAMEYRLTLLEIQKLAYFLQESGQPLRLRYTASHYGPYAPNLNKVLEVLEGHFIRGYGDSQKPDVEITLLESAAQEADAFLSDKLAEQKRLNRVGTLIEGFETPYGMELLASVHWGAVHDQPPVQDAEQAIEAIHRWSERKRQMFRPEHIRIAWRHLDEQGWLAKEVLP